MGRAWNVQTFTPSACKAGVEEQFEVNTRTPSEMTFEDHLSLESA